MPESFKNREENLSPVTDGEPQEHEDLELKQKRNLDRRRHNIEYVFDAFEDGDKRVEYILTKIVNPIKDLGFEVSEKDIESLKEFNSITDRKKFIDAVVPVLMPMWEFKRSIPDPEMRGINRALAYEVKDGMVELTFSTTGLETFRLIRTFKEGLKELAKAIKDDKSVTEIWGDSQIIKEHPRLLERLGFSVVEGKYVWSQRAEMSKEEFLKRFLEE